MSHKTVCLAAFFTLAFQSLGVVFGDIGTSPLYVLTAMLGPDPSFYTKEHVYGAVGLIFVTLFGIVGFYCAVVLRINQQGDGGITVLYSISKRKIDKWWARVGISGVISDGQITPAISILSAWWGLLSVPAFVALTVMVQHYGTDEGWLALPATDTGVEAQRLMIGHSIAKALAVLALIVLAWIQKKGSSKIGTMFGPIMLGWFFMLVWGGMPQIMSHPGILQAPLRFDCMWSLLTHDLPWWKSLSIFWCDGDRLARRVRYGALGGNRRRGALCRHGALRSRPHHGCVHARHVRPHRQLRGAGCIACRLRLQGVAVLRALPGQ